MQETRGEAGRDRAAFQACFTDWRLIKGRKVVQVVLEVPLELADAAYQALGGMPDPAKSVWCGIARLQEATAGVDRSSPAKAREGDGQERSATPSRRPQKSWHNMGCAEQAGVLCKDTAFHKFLQKTLPGPWKLLNGGDDNEKAALIVRAHCGVKSRSEIQDNDFAMVKWHAMVSDYRAWVAEPEVVF